MFRSLPDVPSGRDRIRRSRLGVAGVGAEGEHPLGAVEAVVVAEQGVGLGCVAGPVSGVVRRGDCWLPQPACPLRAPARRRPRGRRRGGYGRRDRPFLDAVADRAARRTPGTPDDEHADFGPLAGAAQLATVLDSLERLPDHAEVVAGGLALPGPGFFHQATVVAGVRQEDEVVRGEVFGPVVTIQPFTREAGAFGMANTVPQDMAASVWTRDHDRAMHASRALHTGIVWMTTHGTTVSEMPRGGVRHSGYGSDLSLTGLLDYTQVKHVTL
ncbi:aldehyde dehydrogenase family protein [Streptomyces sp. NPDC058145]|uniref:aldehyde dehydrogenase family protein n=1 Tax=Streptomyces sp. NPDC058145 TaxID=3346356 RepID=UPI0036EF119E